MAKNDYFVIVYKILKYLYECFKAGEKPDIEAFSPDTLGIPNGYWINIMESLSDEGYIKGIFISSVLGGSKTAKMIDLKITPKGIAYLQDNSMIEKAKNALTTLQAAKNIISGI